ncbi:uncharacterized protein LOC144572790 [Carex rostrata]
MRGFGLMFQFNDLIRELQLIDVQLQNRDYTWSNMQPVPIFSKLDRCFLTSDWAMMYPIITLTALETIVSDHVPLLLHMKTPQQRKSHKRLERFWFKYRYAHCLTNTIWETAAQQVNDDPLKEFEIKTEKLHKELGRWHQTRFVHMDDQLQYCKKAILFFDKIEEKRKLDRREFCLRQKIRERAFELSSNLEIRWHQRSRCNWLTSGDRNTRFFHAYASARARKNAVVAIEVQGNQITDQRQILKEFSKYMQALLGTQVQSLNFDPGVIYREEQPSLNHLQQPFTTFEIHKAVRQLANNKAPGPDGLPHEFFKDIWSLLKEDVQRIFDDF